MSRGRSHFADDNSRYRTAARLMGARLVSAALNPHWSKLTHLQRNVLVIMAQTALDYSNNGHQPCVYWGGHDYLALCIFGSPKPPTHQLQTLSRAVSVLIEVRAIERLEAAGGRHRRARYRLTLDGFDLPPLPDD
jgi:hypothetical protein